MRIIGIDPGASGGIACISPSETIWLQKLDDTERDVVDALREFAQGSCFAYLERVGAMPGQGVTSMFNFGRGYGFLRGALIALSVPFEEVTPQKWQGEFSLKRTDKNEKETAKKNRHKAKAQQLFPSEKVTHWNADALLIAEYGRRLRFEKARPA